MKYIAIILFAVLAAVGCTRTVYVPKETVRTEYRDRVQFDSIYERDSVFVRIKGDTVYIYKDKYIYRDKLVRDTVSRIDSVSYPVIVEVEKVVKYIPPVYRWSFVAVLVAAGIGIFALIRKFKGK